MNCSICEQHGITSVALWQVGKAGYCRGHKAEAYAEEAKKAQGRNKAKLFGETFDKLEKESGTYRQTRYEDGRGCHGVPSPLSR
jgi:hypothetical protein